MTAIKKGKVKDLKLDPQNANIHSEFGTGLLENSTRENGIGRSILISSDNVVIAGNGLTEAANAIGIEDLIVVESDGRKVVAVKRTDIKSGTAAFYNMALADNIVAQKNIVMDANVVEAIAEAYPSTKVWAAIVTDPPGTKEKSDKEDTVEMKFQFTGAQYTKMKQALKMSKEMNKAKFQEGENASDQAKALFLIVQDWVKTHKK